MNELLVPMVFTVAGLACLNQRPAFFFCLKGSNQVSLLQELQLVAAADFMPFCLWQISVIAANTTSIQASLAHHNFWLVR